MRVLAIANPKGGCGRTTVAINLGAFLASLDRRVLILDLDPQAHCTLGLSGQIGEARLTTSDLLDPTGREREVQLQEILIPAGERLSVGASCHLLEEVRQRLSCKPGSMSLLHRKISLFKEPADFVLIDCPPGMGPLTMNALVASTEVLIPVDPSPYSVQGAKSLVSKLLHLEAQRGETKRLWILPCRYSPHKRLHKRLRQELEELFPAHVMSACIRSSVRVPDSACKGQPLLETANRSSVSGDFRKLAMEVMQSLSAAKARFLPVEQPVELDRALDAGIIVQPSPEGRAGKGRLSMKNQVEES